MNNSSSYQHKDEEEEMRKVEEMIQKLVQMSSSGNKQQESGGYQQQSGYQQTSISEKQESGYQQPSGYQQDSWATSSSDPPATIILKKETDQQTVSTEASSLSYTEPDGALHVEKPTTSYQQQTTPSPYQRAQQMAECGVSEGALEESKLQADAAEKQARIMREAVAASQMDREGGGGVMHKMSVTTCVDAFLRCLADPVETVSTVAGSRFRSGYESMGASEEELQRIRIPNYSSHGTRRDNGNAYDEIYE